MVGFICELQSCEENLESMCIGYFMNTNAIVNIESLSNNYQLLDINNK